jgi:integrase
MSSITKLSNGRYRARYRDPNGRSRSRTFARKLDAQSFLDDTSTDVRRGEWVDPRKSRETFDAWADRWWRTTVKFRPTTRRGWHGLLERHVRPYFTGRKVTEIDWADVEDFIASKLEAEFSPKYVREAVSVLSLVMQLAVNSKVRRDNPAAGHRLPVRQRKIRQGDVLSMEQAHRLVGAVPGPYKSAVWMLMLTGMRPAELCGLRVSSVDLLRGEVHVTESLLPVHKFGDQPYHRDVTGPTKTEASDRGIPIPRWLSDDLATMLAERAARHGQAVEPSEYLFQTRYGNPINRDKFRENVMRPALRAAGLPETIRTYDLRHSHASLLIELGASPLAVAQRLGHTDPAMTLRVYGHLFEGVQERLTDQLDSLRETTAGTATTGSVVALPGHNRDTRDTRKTRNQGHVRSTSAKSR